MSTPKGIITLHEPKCDPAVNRLFSQIARVVRFILSDLDGDRSFECLGCGWIVSADFGAADDSPDLCDDCWCAIHG